MSSGSLKGGHIVETRCGIRTPGLFMFSKGPSLVGPRRNQAPLLAILYMSENLRPLSEMHKWRFVPPNDAISAEQYRREI
jgi:hypothetical protein